jgi:ABC-type transporter MlaC component
MRATSVCGIMIMVVLVGLPTRLLAETPTQALQEMIDRLQSALRDPSPGEEIRAQRVWEAVLTQFDLREMSKRLLGSYWEGSVEQQEVFLAAFTAYMQRTFAQKLAMLKDAKLICRDEAIQGSVAKVLTSVSMSGEDVNIKFHMHQQGSAWKIYDVVLDNGRFSLVSSYRAQLQWILRTSSFDELLRVIRGKNAW